MYPPSMLSSAALAAAAGSLGAAADSVEAPHGSMAAYKQQQLHSDQLVKQLQILTRVENVSFFFKTNLVSCKMFSLTFFYYFAENLWFQVTTKGSRKIKKNNVFYKP